MLDLKLEDIDGILVRYNVALEKEMTPDEAAEELYPKDDLIYPVAKAIYEGEEDDVVDALQLLSMQARSQSTLSMMPDGRNGSCNPTLRRWYHFPPERYDVC